MAIIDRWHELEATEAARTPALPQTYKQALLQLIESVDKNKEQALLLESQKPAVEFHKKFTAAEGLFGVRKAAQAL